MRAHANLHAFASHEQPRAVDFHGLFVFDGGLKIREEFRVGVRRFVVREYEIFNRPAARAIDRHRKTRMPPVEFRKVIVESVLGVKDQQVGV